MSMITIKDLDMSKELDHQAMAKLSGGYTIGKYISGGGKATHKYNVERKRRKYPTLREKLLELLT